MTSVIIPVYNVQAYLNECIDSVLSQTYHDFEVILINDGSTDESGKICDDYSLLDSRVKVIHKTNSGVSETRNIGIAAAKGEYLLFLDSDDRIDKNTLMILNKHILDCDMVLFRYEMFRNTKSGEEYIDSNDDFITPGSYSKIEMLKQFCNNNLSLITVCFKFCRIEIAKANPFPVGKICEDEMVTHRFINSCEKITVISDVLYQYRENLNGITHDKNFYRNTDRLYAFADRVILLKKYGLNDAINKQALNFYLFFCGSYPYCIINDSSTATEIYKLFSDLYYILKSNPLLNFTDKIKLKCFKYFPKLYCRIYRLIFK